MRKTVLFAILFITAQITFGQRYFSKIDSLNSKEDVERLIHSFDKRYQEFVLKPIIEFKNRLDTSDVFCKKIADSLKITESFYKADFDNNGYTDILVIGDFYDFTIFVLMNYGHDSLTIKRLTKSSFQGCTFPVVKDNKIKYYFERYPDYGEKDASRKLEQVTLFYKFEDFIEENTNPAKHKIEKIEYETTGCLGICPSFKLTVNSNKRANWFAYRYNKIGYKTVKGNFKTIISSTKFKEIIDLLNYIDFEKLKNNYSVNWDDDQESSLKITYDNGKTKSIKDYGLIGTFGLNRLHQLLFDLRGNQKWTR